jgi:hypothetical protein
MYVKRHAVQRGDKRYVYLRLVEAYRDQGGKVRHRVLKTLGREDQLKTSGQLDQLAASFARLDPPSAGTRREVGPLLLVRHYLDRLGLIGLVDQAAPMRGRAMLTHGEVIAALVANRLAAPSPLYDIAGWASSAAMAELFDIPAMLLNDDRLGRALEALAPVAEHVRGSLALAAASRGGADLSRLHLDLTAVRFAGAYEDSALVEKGWAADRTVKEQVRTLQASTPDGIAVYFRPHPGARGELPCFAEAMQRLQAIAPPGLVVVADSGLGYLRQLCIADRNGLRFVVPLRADTGWAKTFTTDLGGLDQLEDLDYCSQREQPLPPAKRTTWRGLLRPYPALDPDTKARHGLRVAYIWSSEEAASVRAGRERALAKAEAALAKIRSSRSFVSVSSASSAARARAAASRTLRSRCSSTSSAPGRRLTIASIRPRVKSRRAAAVGSVTFAGREGRKRLVSRGDARVRRRSVHRGGRAQRAAQAGAARLRKLGAQVAQPASQIAGRGVGLVEMRARSSGHPARRAPKYGRRGSWPARGPLLG